MHIRLAQAPMRRFYAAGAALAGVVLLLGQQSFAENATTIFSRLKGTWSGEGIISLSNGSKERIRCRGDYRLPRRDNLQLQLDCASDSYKFALRGDILADGHLITGTWDELTRKVGGKITGHLSGDRIEARAEGETFSALLSLTTRGSHQAVSIQSPGSEMSGITITLRRR